MKVETQSFNPLKRASLALGGLAATTIAVNMGISKWKDKISKQPTPPAPPQEQLEGRFVVTPYAEDHAYTGSWRVSYHVLFPSEFPEEFNGEFPANIPVFDKNSPNTLFSQVNISEDRQSLIISATNLEVISEGMRQRLIREIGEKVEFKFGEYNATIKALQLDNGMTAWFPETVKPASMTQKIEESRTENSKNQGIFR